MSSTTVTRSGTPATARRPATKTHKQSRLHRRSAAMGWMFASPALLVVAAVMIFPIIFSVIMSISNVDVTGTGIHLSGITGANYSVLFHAERWRHAVYFTLVYTLITVTVEIILGTLIALVLERLEVARGWMMALLLLPWAMITVISADLWGYIYNGVYGVLNYLMHPFLGHDLNVLGSAVPATTAMAVADIWKTTPFVAIIVVAGLVMLPSDMVEAARIDGASAWTIFWRIRLPLLRPTIALAVMFRVLQAFGLFDLPFVLTNGGPGTSTESLAVLGYRVLFTDLKFGPGAAVATSTAAIVLVACLALLKVFKTQVGQEEI